MIDLSQLKETLKEEQAALEVLKRRRHIGGEACVEEYERQKTIVADLAELIADVVARTGGKKA